MIRCHIISSLLHLLDVRLDQALADQLLVLWGKEGEILFAHPIGSCARRHGRLVLDGVWSASRRESKPACSNPTTLTTHINSPPTHPPTHNADPFLSLPCALVAMASCGIARPSGNRGPRGGGGDHFLTTSPGFSHDRQALDKIEEDGIEKGLSEKQRTEDMIEKRQEMDDEELGVPGEDTSFVWFRRRSPCRTPASRSPSPHLIRPTPWLSGWRCGARKGSNVARAPDGGRTWR